MSRLPEVFSIDKDGCLNVKVDISYNPDMKKQRIVSAVEEYIECPCGGEMKFSNSLNYAGIWECCVCKKRTATIYNVLNMLKKVKEE